MSIVPVACDCLSQLCVASQSVQPITYSAKNAGYIPGVTCIAHFAYFCYNAMELPFQNL